MDYQWQAKIFRLLGNPVRIQILALLARGPLYVSDLIRCTHYSQAYVSQQLMVLRSIGWVDAHKEGLTVCYHLLDTPETRCLRRLINEMEIIF